MADAGLGSRREMERWIEAGRVTVNGKRASLGDRIGSEDQVTVDGAPLHHRAETTARVLIMNKADGVVCTRRDPEGRPTCFDGLPKLAGAALGRRRPSRHQLERSAAADQRRRTGAPA